MISPCAHFSQTWIRISKLRIRMALGGLKGASLATNHRLYATLEPVAPGPRCRRPVTQLSINFSPSCNITRWFFFLAHFGYVVKTRSRLLHTDGPNHNSATSINVEKETLSPSFVAVSGCNRKRDLNNVTSIMTLTIASLWVQLKKL